MKTKLFLSTLTISFCIASQAISENIKIQRLIEHTSINRDGLYEIISPRTGNVIYLYALRGQPTQMYAVPSGLTSKPQNQSSERRAGHN